MKKYPDHIKLQVPIDPEVYQELKKRAEEFGFDSVQAYVRFWAKAETRKENPEDLTKVNSQALRYFELLLATNKRQPETMEEALDHAVKELRRIKGSKYLRELLR